jgi:hypothetical protein
MRKDMKVYQFNNIPLPPPYISFICSHVVFNNSSSFMSILILILIYNMDMKRKFNMHLI